MKPGFALADHAGTFALGIAALTFAVGMMHFKNGAQMAIEDYVHGLAGRLTIIAVTLLAYTIAAVSIFALIRLAL